MTRALEAWGKGAGGRREAFKHARALLAALDLPAGADPVENAEAAAKRVRKKDDAPALAEILKELPRRRAEDRRCSRARCGCFSSAARTTERWRC